MKKNRLYKNNNRISVKRKYTTKTTNKYKQISFKPSSKTRKNKNKSSKLKTNHNFYYPSSLQSNLTQQSHKLLYEKQYVLLPKLKGGKFIDKGAYGCVVTPAISCSNYDNNNSLDKYVSKIIKNPDDSDISDELKISNFLKKIDPLQKYFITYEKLCRIYNLPKERTDLISVKYKNDDMKEYETIGDTKNKDKHVCDIELALKPVNLIMKHGGNSLSSIMKVDRKSDGMIAKMHNLFVNDLKYYFKHLIIGLIKMHTNKIVNRDIKQRNILIKFNSKINTESKKNKEYMEIRFIDFGLSDIITSDMYKDISSIRLKGTYIYLSPELFICYIIAKYYNRSRDYHMKKINIEFNEYVKKALLKINEKELIITLNKNIDVLYDKIKNLFDKDKILEAYLGSEIKIYNGYLQKADVYALGISIYDTLYHYSKIDVKKNSKLYDLLINMINIDPDKRYNIIQCLSHPYFKE